jgi:hypothetical protein
MRWNFMEPRILKDGEKVTGRYRNIEMGKSKRSFRVRLGNEVFYLPKNVGDSLQKSHQKGNEMFTIQRRLDVYEIMPLGEGAK